MDEEASDTDGDDQDSALDSPSDCNASDSDDD